MFTLKLKLDSGQTIVLLINLYGLNGIISHLINKGKKLYCAFLDFRKAFDYVDRNFL